MDFGKFLETMAKQEESRDKVSAADFVPYLSYFDNRDFQTGDYVQKRTDSKDRGENGICNYQFPIRGEPALVVGHCDPWKPQSGGYERETLVILTFDAEGEPIRVMVDPVHFERYETQGERILREIGE